MEQAAEWYACLRDGKFSAKEQAKWRAWLSESEEHMRAWRYVEEVSRSFEPILTMPNARVVAETLSAAQGRVYSRRRILTSVTLLACGSMLGWLSWRHTGVSTELLALTADHHTGTGEQRELTLADGSRLWLNTASAINIDFNVRERRIELVTGEIFVETAPDPARDFVVDTTQGRIRALGTRFNVRSDHLNTQLAVYEGAVQIRTTGNGSTAIINSGEQTDFTLSATQAPSKAQAAHEAWVRGTLVAENIQLREVIQELRRYRKGYLGVADEVANLTVYGNFPVHDTDQVLRMLASALPIRISQPLPWWTTIEARR